MSAKRGLRIRGLRQRWLVNAVLPIVLVVIAIVTVYTLGVRRTYYSAMRSGLETRARVAADNFSSYGLKSYSEYYRRVTNMVAGSYKNLTLAKKSMV